MSDDEIGILIVSLRALASDAPPGPWHREKSSGYGNPSVQNADGPLCSTGNSKNRTRREKETFARYVAAANPDTMLVLLAALERAIGDRNALVAAIDRLEAAVRL